MLRTVSFSIIIFSCVLLTPSCINTGCTDPTADNYEPDATESSGNCIPARDKFLGNYSVQEQCSDTAYAYGITIDIAVTGINNVIIQNLGDYSLLVNASVSGSLIEIETDTFSNMIISGSGEISGYTLLMHYTAIDLITTDTTNCNITALKQ